MATTIFDFSVPGNYTLSHTVIANAIASLTRDLPSSTVTKTSNFGTPGDYTYDNTLIDLTSGAALLKDQRPANATFGATFTNSINANWGGGSQTATPLGTGAISGGKLVCNGTGAAQYVATGNAQIVNTGTVRMKVTPLTLSGTMILWSISQSSASANNYATLYWTGNNLHFYLNNSAGALIVHNVFGVWTPVSGQTYEIELDIDLTGGATRLFVDGVQLGATLATTTAARTNAIGILNIGADYPSPTTPSYFNGSFDDVEIFSTVQHTSDYTPGYVVQESIYPISNPTIDFTVQRIDSTLPFFANIDNITASIVAAGSDAVQFAVSVDDGVSWKYWDGAAWSASTGYAQSNPLATLLTNLPTLDLTGKKFELRAFLHGVTGTGTNTTPSLDNVVVTYRNAFYRTDGGSITTNSGFTAQTLTSFLSTLSIAGSDTLTFALIVNGTKKYWTGAAWATSDGTFAQTNALAVIQAHLATLLTVNSTVKVYILLVSADGTTTPTITDFTASYNFGDIEGPVPTTCDVFGFLRDIEGNPVVGALITFQLVPTIKNMYMEAASHVLWPSSVSATTDANGYFEKTVLTTAQFEGTKTQIKVTITKGSDVESVNEANTALVISVPVQASADLTDLLTA